MMDNELWSLHSSPIMMMVALWSFSLHRCVWTCITSLNQSYFIIACGQKCCFKMCFGCYETHFNAFAVRFSSHLLFKRVFFASLMAEVVICSKAVPWRLPEPDLAEGRGTRLSLPEDHLWASQSYRIFQCLHTTCVLGGRTSPGDGGSALLLLLTRSLSEICLL